MKTDCFMGCTPTGDDGERFYMASLLDLTIYGHTVDEFTKKTYPEDMPLIEDMRAQGEREWGCWHSVACPDGEIGSNPLYGLVAIDYATFDEARQREWPNMPLVTRPEPASAVYTVDDTGTATKVWDSVQGDV